MADVVLLAEVFEEYRAKGLSNWQLDPAQFVTAPSYTYKAFLKYIDRPIQVMWDLGMYEFFRDAMRGGYCSVGEMVFANVYKKEGECIVGFDMNSLYPTAMLHPMPLCDFEWISGEEGERILRDKSYNWLESEMGYWLEVDICARRTSMIASLHIHYFPRESMANSKQRYGPKFATKRISRIFGWAWSLGIGSSRFIAGSSFDKKGSWLPTSANSPNSDEKTRAIPRWPSSTSS
jgi:hypothetical protein